MKIVYVMIYIKPIPSFPLLEPVTKLKTHWQNLTDFNVETAMINKPPTFLK